MMNSKQRIGKVRECYWKINRNAQNDVEAGKKFSRKSQSKKIFIIIYDTLKKSRIFTSALV